MNQERHIFIEVSVINLITKMAYIMAAKLNPPASTAQDLDTIKSKHKVKRKANVKRRKKK